MNHYEEKQAARKARYEGRAEQARSAAQSTHARAQQMAEAIPFGQPILIGHHSEGRDRNYRAKITRTYGKAYELDNKADYYESKAAAAGTGGISGDDPEAISKLKVKLQGLIAAQDAMKKANAVIRQRMGDEDAQIDGILALGCFTNEQARDLVRPDYAAHVGFPAYALQNNNANIQRVKKRIKELEQASERQPVELAKDGYTYREDVEDNRAMFIFEGKPEKATRDTLKRHGFRWSPTRGAWVRQLSNAAIWQARAVMQILDVQTET